MLGFLWKIIGILGMVLLALLAVLFAVLLLALFFPITYRVHASRKEGELKLSAGAKWLFGFIRVDFGYPNPGKLAARLLGIRIFETGGDDEEPEEDAKKEEGAQKPGKSTKQERKQEKPGKTAKKEDKRKGSKESAKKKEAGKPKESAGGSEEGAGQEKEAQGEPSGKPNEGADAQPAPDGTESAPKEGGSKPLFETVREKGKHFKEALEGLVRKGKEVLGKVGFYWGLMREEDTLQLFSHGMFRLGRILKSIRPRRVKGWLHFGTGSPDTTGYCMALYGMLSPYLGNAFAVTTDFEEAVLEGELDTRGHVLVAVLLFHVVRVLLDRRFHALIRKLKREGK